MNCDFDFKKIKNILVIKSFEKMTKLYAPKTIIILKSC